MRKKEGKHALSRKAYISHMRQAAPSAQILVKLGISFGVDDIISFSKFHVRGSRGSEFLRARKSLFPIGKRSRPKHCA